MQFSYSVNPLPQVSGSAPALSSLAPKPSFTFTYGGPGMPNQMYANGWARPEEVVHASQNVISHMTKC